MALLWAQLPAESRTARARSPELAWSTGEYLLWQIEHQLRCMAWSMADKRHRSAKPPQPLPTPARRAEAARHRDNALAHRAELDRRLGIGG